MTDYSVRSILVPVVAVAVVSSVAIGCRRREPPTPPAATPSIKLNHSQVPLGSPIEITYRFVVAGDARFGEDYRVMMHVVDVDEELMWTDDHDPPVPTTQWKPGQTIEYTRTIFAPIFPYVGDATIQVGLYSVARQKRLTLSGDDTGQQAYRVGRIQLLPQSDNVFLVFKEGWHQAEVADQNPSVEWQWTKKEATLSFRNPKKDCVFFFDVDAPGGVFEEGQTVQIGLGDQVVDRFALKPKERLLRKIPLTAAQLGTSDAVELRVVVDKTFVPAKMGGPNSQDKRELGVRVFHAFVDAR
jgi:hypothetical protein